MMVAEPVTETVADLLYDAALDSVYARNFSFNRLTSLHCLTGRIDSSYSAHF
jgi:hypothetical protein